MQAKDLPPLATRNATPRELAQWADLNRTRPLTVEEWEALERTAMALRMSPEMRATAHKGRWLIERDEAQIEDMLAGSAFDELLRETIPGRMAARQEAGELVRLLRFKGHLVYAEDGSARVFPPCPEHAGRVYDLDPFIMDLLDEESR